MHTAYELVAAAADRTPDHSALVDDLTGRVLSYGEMMAEVNMIAAGLAERGVTRGSRFATVMPNRLEHCLTILALARLGAVAALMNARLPPSDIVRLMTRAQISGALLTDNPELVAAVTESLGPRAVVLSTGAAAGAESFDDCTADPASLGPVPPAAADELAYIFYTSGTTGLPKGVALDHRTTLPRVLWISALVGLPMGRHIRTLGLAPLSHVIGFHGNFLMSLAYNGTYFTSSAFRPAAALELIERERISVLFTVPTFYRALLAVDGYRPEQLSSIELLLWGGAAIQPDLLAALQRDCPDATVAHIYGTTETMCSLYNPDPRDEPTRLRPGLFSNVRVVNPGSGPEDRVPVGAKGELLISTAADTIFSGYLDMPEATADKVRDGWYRTGDICTVREDGDLELSGRVDDIIRSGGENIHPDEVEAVLSPHPGIRDLGVVGIPDDYWGEMVVACVVADEGVTAAELDSVCRQSPLADYKRPRGYLFVGELPRNAARKLLRRELRKLPAEDVIRI